MTLEPDYKNVIIQSKEIYVNLGVSITPKVHILIEHVPDFLPETWSFSGMVL